MKLFYVTGSCSLTIRIILNELSLPCDYISVDMSTTTKRTQTGDDFLQINPKGSVPALQLDDGNMLTEINVILQYLADTQKNSQLLPVLGDFKRYRVLEWLNYVATELHKNLGLLLSSRASADVKNFFHPIVKQKFTFVNQQLANKNYLLGETFTLPDAYLFVMLSWAVVYLKMDMSEWPQLEKFFLHVQARPSVHASLKQEGLLSVGQT